LILLLTLAAYWPATRAGFIWDDDDMLTANPIIQEPGGLAKIWSGSTFYDFWPVTLTSLWIEWRCWGMNPAGYHITNILLHGGAAILFWRVLKRLSIPAAWLAALIFAVHPMTVQSVAWITERKNTLSLFFGFLSVLWYLRFDEQSRAERAKVESSKFKVQSSKLPSTQHATRNTLYALSLSAFILALLSKTSVAMLPFMLIACVWWQRTKKSEIRNPKSEIRKRPHKAPHARFTFHASRITHHALRLAPFLVLGLIFGLVTIWFQYHRSISTETVTSSDFRQRLVNAGFASWFYLARILFPRHPTFVYPRWTFSPENPLNYLPGAAMLALVGLFWVYRKTWGRPCFFGFAWFLAMLFPVLGFFKIYFQKYSFVADHWLYPALPGVIALIVGGSSHVLTSHITHHAPRSTLHAPRLLALALVLLLASLTRSQTRIYKDEETLWRATLRSNPKCWLACHNLAALLVSQTRSPSPDPAASSANQQKLNEALGLEQRTIALKPDHASANFGAATVLAMENRLAEALPYYRQAVTLQPDLLSAVDALAWILATHETAALRNGPEALRLAKTAVSLSGGDPKTLDTLAVASAEAGDFPGAIAAAEQALKLAAASGDTDLVHDLRMQIQLFQSHRPFHMQ
jgi:tetratricopeptide (TPR) repeat protein